MKPATRRLAESKAFSEASPKRLEPGASILRSLSAATLFGVGSLQESEPCLHG